MKIASHAEHIHDHPHEHGPGCGCGEHHSHVEVQLLQTLAGLLFVIYLIVFVLPQMGH